MANMHDAVLEHLIDWPLSCLYNHIDQPEEDESGS